MTGPISRNRLLGSLKEAASWPGADRSTVVTLATALVAARADAEGSSYFQDLSERNPADATAQALAGFFEVRAGHDVAAAIAKLDEAATTEVGLPQYFRDSTLGSPRTVWVAPHGDDLYVRSVNGPAADWFRGTRVRHEGHIRAGGVGKDVAFVDADHSIDDQIDAAYRTKYRRYARSVTDRITSPGARSTTIKLVPSQRALSSKP